MKRFPTLVRVLIFCCILSTPLYAYVTRKVLSSSKTIMQIKWPSGPINWQMTTTPGSNISGSREVGDVMRQSFRTWSSIPTALISFTEGPPVTVKAGNDGKNVVVTNLKDNDWTALGLDQSILALTVSFFSDTGQLLDADIVFNPSLSFSTNDTVPPDKIDFQSVLTHEIGHLLGLDHTPSVSSTMFWVIRDGMANQRTPTADDIAGVSSIYPSASFFSKGTLQGTVRTTANVPVYGAVVVAVNSNGQSVASVITDMDGRYSIAGLDAGQYTVYAQTLDVFTNSDDFPTLSRINPGQKVTTGFTARFR